MVVFWVTHGRRLVRKTLTGFVLLLLLFFVTGRPIQTLIPKKAAGDSLHTGASGLPVQAGQRVEEAIVQSGSFFDRLVELLKRYYRGELQ
ncbi:hypothetical protein EDD75_0162 [Thermodesulfitimonas autotrophica]|uniref:Uncharacterized protein n=1 Tax=Thermodesulfitimonas autotrophica TaxID=1894989 RepID=A0A3N5AWK6_9THEO|nr:hypothetical protein [Thermodesulfitimonas autotrophica]RPF49354.1 hypothetical protein EDD75_0162 [Thermodesulfitimonas autotrophica]